MSKFIYILWLIVMCIIIVFDMWFMISTESIDIKILLSLNIIWLMWTEAMNRSE